MIGPGRARPTPSTQPGARGAAAGVITSDAQRDDLVRPHAPKEQILLAIRHVASQLALRPERLLMIDYQQRAISDPQLPPVREVLAAFGSWKVARRRASLRS